MSISNFDRFLRGIALITPPMNACVAVWWIFFAPEAPSGDNTTVSDSVLWFMPIVSAAFSTILVIISQVSSNSSAERDTRIRFSNADVAIAALSPSTHTLICLNLYCTEVAETWRGLKPYTKADMEIWFVCGLFLPLVMLLFLAAFVVPAWVPFCQMLQFRVVKKEDSEYTTVEEASV